MSDVSILVDYSLCTGCKICLLSCSEKKHASYIPSRALLRIREYDNVYHSPVVCMQCGNSACLRVCPVNAIFKNNEGIIEIDSNKCTGCGICQKYCPQQVIKIYAEDNSNKRQAHKCNLCGGTPTCTEACPTGALKVVRR